MHYFPDLETSDILEQSLSKFQTKEDTNEKHERQSKDLLVDFPTASITNGLDCMIQCVNKFNWRVVLVSTIKVFNQTYAMHINFSYLVYRFDMEHGTWDM